MLAENMSLFISDNEQDINICARKSARIQTPATQLLKSRFLHSSLILCKSPTCDFTSRSLPGSPTVEASESINVF